MPATMTQTTLLEDITGYCERTAANDTVFQAQRPRFIMLAENAIAAQLKGLGVQQVVTSTLTTGSNALAKPAYWRNSLSFKIELSSGRTKPLLLRSLEFCQSYAVDPSVAGEPVYYADYDYEQFMIAPTPDSAYPFELVFLPRITPLDENTQVNWLTINAPQLLLYRTLVEAQDFLKNYDKSAYWMGRYNEQLAALAAEDGARQADRVTVVK